MSMCKCIHLNVKHANNAENCQAASGRNIPSVAGHFLLASHDLAALDARDASGMRVRDPRRRPRNWISGLPEDAIASWICRLTSEHL